MRKSTGKKKNLKWGGYALLALLIFAGYHTFSGPAGIFNLARLEKKKQAQLREIDSLQRRKSALENEKTRLRNDSGYLELLARKRLNMAKPDEKVFRFMAPE